MSPPKLGGLLRTVVVALLGFGGWIGSGNAALISWDLTGAATTQSSFTVSSGGFDLTVTGGIITSSAPLGLAYTDVARSSFGIGTCSEGLSDQQCAFVDTSEPPNSPNDEFLRLQLPGAGWAPVAMLVVDVLSNIAVFGAHVADPEASGLTPLSLTLLESEELSPGVLLLGLGFPSALDSFEYLFLSNGGTAQGGLIVSAFTAIQVPEPGSLLLLAFGMMLFASLPRARLIKRRARPAMRPRNAGL